MSGVMYGTPVCPQVGGSVALFVAVLKISALLLEAFIRGPPPIVWRVGKKLSRAVRPSGRNTKARVPLHILRTERLKNTEDMYQILL